MFEAVLTLCLAAAPETCRETLLPGYEAGSAAACAQALAAAPPDTGHFAPLDIRDAPRCAEAPPGLPVQEVAPGVFVHAGAVAEPDAANRGDVSNAGFVIGDRAVAVIDTGGSRAVGEGLWRALRARTDLPLGPVVLTHMHPDHVFGVSVFAEAGGEVIGHAGLGRALADRQANYAESFAREIGGAAFIGSRAVPPDTVVETPLRRDLGGRTLVIESWPLAHTGTDVTVLDSATGTLFAGDLVFDAHAPALDGSLRGWQTVLAELTARSGVERVVPGHGAASLDWPGGAAPLARYLDVLARDIAEAIAEGRRLAETVDSAAAQEAARWALFEAYNPRNATVAYTELEWE